MRKTFGIADHRLTDFMDYTDFRAQITEISLISQISMTDFWIGESVRIDQNQMISQNNLYVPYEKDKCLYVESFFKNFSSVESI
jgi:hypothetical protein